MDIQKNSDNQLGIFKKPAEQAEDFDFSVLWEDEPKGDFTKFVIYGGAVIWIITLILVFMKK